MDIRLATLACTAAIVALPNWAASPVEELLQKNCAECHSEKVRTSGFSVASLDAVLQGGNKHGAAVIARRVYLDLIGMPPSTGELQSFLSDESPDAYEKLIDKLLADPRYGERWGRHWLDLARYGETSGLEGDGPIGNVWRYRDWVIDAFASDMPYDQFVIKQLAGGDEHSKTRNNYPPDIQGHIPLAFLRLAPWGRSNPGADA